MKTAVLAASLLFLASAAFAEQTAMEVSWAKLKAEGKLQAGKVVSRDGRQMLKVVNRQTRELRVTVLALENPPIDTTTYALVGKVGYEGVKGKGYLEMLSYFPGEGPYFTKTVESEGPARYIQGASEPRDFILPFTTMGKKIRPIKLRLSVVLPGPGTVYLSDLRLVKGVDAATVGAVGELGRARPWFFGRSPGWWSPRVGSVMGAALGVLGGLLGVLIGVLVPRGRGRKLVLGIMRAGVAVGALSLAFGVVALAKLQPFWVYWILLLTGLLFTLIFGTLLPATRRAYDQLELRRMAAQDAG